MADKKLQNVLQKINEQMYERNVELTVKNRTLSALQELYEIINTSLGEYETAKRMIHVVTHQMKYRGGAILMLENGGKNLNTLATASARKTARKQNIPILKKLNTLSFNTKQKNNVAVEVARIGKRKITRSLHDILAPHVSVEEAQRMQTQLQVQTFVLFPLMFAGKTRGVLVVGMDKLVKDLSTGEKDTLKEVLDVIAIGLRQAKIYSDLKKANKKLKELDQMKDDFVSVASHELRTPMTAIKSYLWMALSGKGGKLSEKQKYYLKRSYTSTDRLIKLVNDMLNISRIESGRLSVTFGKVDLEVLTHEVIEEVEPRAKELGLTIDVQPAEIPPVVADPDKIKEVLFNIIGNSLKFTPEGGNILISFFHKGDLITTNVKDSGKGISAQDIPTLFTKFGMVEGSYATNKKATGTGLGLYITKSIINIHGGDVELTSEGEGKGTTVSFTLHECSKAGLTRVQKKSKGMVNNGSEEKGIIHTDF